MEYPKTENGLDRNSETHKCIPDAWRSPHFRQVNDLLVSEKIDGTNGRVILDWGYSEEYDEYHPFVEVLGRTQDDTMVATLIEKKNLLAEAFGVEETHELTERLFRALRCLLHGGETDEELTQAIVAVPTQMIIFGEFFGPGIQKGAVYTDHKSFAPFDVVTRRGLAENGYWGGPYWRPWEDVCIASDILGVRTVPVYDYTASIQTIQSVVRNGLFSLVAERETGKTDVPAEGVVARTDPYLFDGRGRRVMFKLKGKDLP